MKTLSETAQVIITLEDRLKASPAYQARPRGLCGHCGLEPLLTPGGYLKSHSYFIDKGERGPLFSWRECLTGNQHRAIVALLRQRSPTEEASMSDDVVPVRNILQEARTRLPRQAAFAQQMWLTVASWAVASGYDEGQVRALMNEVEHRMRVMHCDEGAALDSVWHDIKAGREIHAD